MIDFIKQDALNEVWCGPRQDNQYIFRLGEITDKTGLIGKVDLFGEVINLPNATDTWHIFQIGQLNPVILNLDLTQAQFVNLPSVMQNNNVFVDVYNDNGLQISKSDIYYAFTCSKDLLVAIRENPYVNIDYGMDNIFLKVYSSSFFELGVLPTTIGNIQVFSALLTSNALITQATNYYTTRKVQGGDLFVYKNGYLCNIENIGIEDQVDIIHDASVKNIIEFDLSDLNVFTSKLDKCRKYTIHYSANNNPGDFDYFDDIDFYVVGYNGNDFTGLYYSRNDPAAVRQLTYRDYSLKTYNVNNLVSRLPYGLNYKIRMVVRNSGFVRDLLSTELRLPTLYRLNEPAVKTTICGIDSNIDLWKAENLEVSSYVNFLNTPEDQVQFTDVASMYGYNAMATRSRPSFFKINNTLRDYPLPATYSYNLTIYEYDIDGLLLGSYVHHDGYVYSISNVGRTFYLELIPGIKSESPVIFTDTMTLPSAYSDYRVYSSTDNVTWVDSTDSLNIYGTQNGVLTKPPGATYSIIIRTDDSIYETTQSLNYTNGILVLTLDPIAGSLPYGKIDVFLNGRSLAEKIDFVYLNNYVYIFNLKYINNGQSQIVTARLYGFCNKDLTRTVIQDAGFVINGVLSENNTFNLRDDRPYRVTVDGCVKDKTEVTFAEDSATGTLVNGDIYCVTDYVPNVKEYSGVDNKYLKDLSVSKDMTLSKYLTMKNKILQSNGSSAATYPLLSLFLSAVVDSVINGGLVDSEFHYNYNDYQVIEKCKPFEYLLLIDPVINQVVNFNDVLITPTLVAYETNVFNYNFIVRVFNIYYNGVIDYNSVINLEVF